MEKMKISDRAKQFMPFAALRGYYEEIRKREFVSQEKRELTEEEIIALTQKVNGIKKGDFVSVIYYMYGEYKVASGVVTAIDLTLKTLTIVKTKIEFENIFEIKDIK